MAASTFILSPAIFLYLPANQGKTIIEKFENTAIKASFAVIILTADDKGISVKEYNEMTDKDRFSFDSMKYRARQNVIFEYGYFCAKLGRDRVCAIFDDGVEKPSDIDGIVYTPSKDQWKNELRKELVSAKILK